MAERVAIIGAGGKMGTRVVNNLIREPYSLLFSEKGAAGITRLQERGLAVTPPEQAAAAADLIVLAVPDALIGPISAAIVPHARSGATVITLDPAAATVGEIALRPDLHYVVSHPCHPPMFFEQPTAEARKDFFGGIAATQDIVVALLQGSEEALAQAEKLLGEDVRPGAEVPPDHGRADGRPGAGDGRGCGRLGGLPHEGGPGGGREGRCAARGRGRDVRAAPQGIAVDRFRFPCRNRPVTIWRAFLERGMTAHQVGDSEGDRP